MGLEGISLTDYDRITHDQQLCSIIGQRYLPTQVPDTSDLPIQESSTLRPTFKCSLMTTTILANTLKANLKLLESQSIFTNSFSLKPTTESILMIPLLKSKPLTPLLHSPHS